MTWPQVASEALLVVFLLGLVYLLLKYAKSLKTFIFISFRASGTADALLKGESHKGGNTLCGKKDGKNNSDIRTAHCYNSDT